MVSPVKRELVVWYSSIFSFMLLMLQQQKTSASLLSLNASNILAQLGLKKENSLTINFTIPAKPLSFFPGKFTISKQKVTVSSWMLNTQTLPGILSSSPASTKRVRDFFQSLTVFRPFMYSLHSLWQYRLTSLPLRNFVLGIWCFPFFSQFNDSEFRVFLWGCNSSVCLTC